MSVILRVEQMHCASCVSRIEQALTPLPGLVSVQVNLAAQTVTVEGAVEEAALLQAMAAIGYPAEPQQLRWHQFELPQMHCASSVGQIERLLQADGRHRQWQTDLASRRLRVYSTAEPGEIARALTDAGYQALWQQQEEDQGASARRLAGQLRQARYRAALALALGGALLLWGWSGMPMAPATVFERWAWAAVGLVTLLVMGYSGGHFFTGAWRSLRHRQATMDTLIALGTGSAWLFSMAVVVVPQWFPEISRHLYFEASAMIIGLINLGQSLELKAKSQTDSALKALLALKPKFARVVVGDQEVERPLFQVLVADLVRIRPGEQVPVDGVVRQGHSLVDESMLTGEPMPVSKSDGDEVNAGTLNKQGSLLVEATRVGQKTALAQIIRLVQHAQGSKPPIARLADRIAAVFVPAVVLVALVSATLWLLLGPEPRLSHALVVLTTVLIIACPCALGLATPMSVINAVGKAAQLGLLVRSGEALQRATEVDLLLVDKTGTLTEGAPALTDLLPLGELPEQQILTLAASLEQGSEHPLAEAVLAAAREQGLELLELDSFNALTGLGVEGRIDGNRWRLGSGELMHRQGVATAEMDRVLTRLAQQGKTPVCLASEQQLVGILAVADPIKADAAESVRQLQQMGVEVVMLTGDHPLAAAAVASRLSLDGFRAQMKPGDKAEEVRSLRQQGRVVAMAGDGINDAPALAEADVGFAMGSGTDVAKETADIVLVRPSIGGVVKAMALSRATLTNIRQNLFGAFIYNGLGIPIAAGVLYPLTGGLLSPVVAGAAMALSSLTVVTNANRLKRFRWP